MGWLLRFELAVHPWGWSPGERLIRTASSVARSLAAGSMCLRGPVEDKWGPVIRSLLRTYAAFSSSELDMSACRGETAMCESAPKVVHPSYCILFGHSVIWPVTAISMRSGLVSGAQYGK